MNRYFKTSAMMMRSFAWMCLFMALGIWGAHAQTPIQDILGNPGKYDGKSITVEGTIDRHIETSPDKEVKFYVIRDDSGGEIRVETTKKLPETGSRHSIEAIVEATPFGANDARLEESSRSQLASAAQNQVNSSESLRQGFSMITVFLIGGLGVLVIVVMAYFAYASSEEPAPAKAPAGDGAPESGESPSDLSSTELGADGEEAETGFPEPSDQRIKSESSSSAAPDDDSEGPETLKFKAPPKTMKFVPGRLVIAAGPDQGKEFRIAGRPTPEGNVVTIGRAEVEGEKAFAHIQLGDTYRTVSRMQAEIIQQDDTILLKNVSETNPTMVNGDHLPTGETTELEGGDMIRMGELMLRYERD